MGHLYPSLSDVLKMWGAIPAKDRPHPRDVIERWHEKRAQANPMAYWGRFCESMPPNELEYQTLLLLRHVHPPAPEQTYEAPLRVRPGGYRDHGLVDHRASRRSEPTTRP